MIEVSRLHEELRLEPDGRLFWRSPRQGRTVGKEVGCLNRAGYRVFGMDGAFLQSHRVVFAMMHGRWPEHEVDHINGIKNDNRPENLREATRAQNGMNVGMSPGNTSGYKGVSWDKNLNKWRAEIYVLGKRIHLGRHNDIDLAGLIYEEAARIYHGEFRRAA